MKNLFVFGALLLFTACNSLKKDLFPPKPTSFSYEIKKLNDTLVQKAPDRFEAISKDDILKIRIYTAEAENYINTMEEIKNQYAID